MSDRSKAAAERIREQVSVLQVLINYGYRVRDDGGYREQQFSCDLHGTGWDNKPSARVYPESNSWYCFACGKSRDAIETVIAKEGVKFWDAVRILEDTFGLEPLPRDYQEDRPDIGSSVQAILDPTKTFDEDAQSVGRFLDNRTTDRDIPLDQLLRFWEKFDQILYYVKGPKGNGGIWPEATGRQALQALRHKVNEAAQQN